MFLRDDSVEWGVKSGFMTFDINSLRLEIEFGVWKIEAVTEQLSRETPFWKSLMKYYKVGTSHKAAIKGKWCGERALITAIRMGPSSAGWRNSSSSSEASLGDKKLELARAKL